MFKLDTLSNQVIRNCNISDSRHAGMYSVCGLALRLRDLYKWEKGLDPWEEKDSSEILEWIGKKEQTWEEIAEKNFTALSLLDRKYDPFDTKEINKILEPHRIFYGAGYAHSLKPTFFLAVIDQKNRVEGYPVYTLGRELARDLLTIPALSQDSIILLRKESAKLYLWDQLLYIKKSGRQALNFALQNCGLQENRPEALRRGLATIFAAQRETYIYHELGELRDNVFDRAIWREIIADYPHTPVELLARAVKDLLADTNPYGTLQYFINERRTAALAFYVAFQDGLAKKLFPELGASFSEFTQTRNWQIVEHALSAGYHTARQYAEIMIDIHKTGKQNKNKKWAKNEIEKRLLKHI